MAFVHGKNSVFKVDDSGGVLRDISAFCEDVDFPQPVDTAEVSTFGVTSKTFVAGLKAATINVSGSFDATVDAYLAGILGNVNTSTFEYGPEGSTSGKIKYTGECWCTNYSVKSGIGGAVKFSASFQVTGNVTRTTY